MVGNVVGLWPTKVAPPPPPGLPFSTRPCVEAATIMVCGCVTVCRPLTDNTTSASAAGTLASSMLAYAARPFSSVALTKRVPNADGAVGGNQQAVGGDADIGEAGPAQVIGHGLRLCLTRQEIRSHIGRLQPGVEQ